MMAATKFIRLTTMAFDAIMKHAAKGDTPAEAAHKALGLPPYRSKRGRKPLKKTPQQTVP